MQPLKHEIDARFRKRYDRHIRIGKLLFKNPFLYRIVAWLHRVLTTMVTDNFNYKQDIDFKVRGMTAQDVPKNAVADPFIDVLTAIDYATQVYHPDFATERHRRESYALYAEQERRLDRLLSSDPSIKGFLNFGVSYGYIDSILAKAFPNLRFVGIDISKHNKAFNEAEFSEIKNLQFVAGDIFDFMEGMDCRGWVLFHSRILCQFPRDFLVKLYNCAYEKGFKYVAGFEQFGYSRQTRAAVVEFSDAFTESVHWRNDMLIHNYPGVIKESGFSVKNANIIKTGHGSPDFRIFCFIAKRGQS